MINQTVSDLLGKYVVVMSPHNFIVGYASHLELLKDNTVYYELTYGAIYSKNSNIKTPFNINVGFVLYDDFMCERNIENDEKFISLMKNFIEESKKDLVTEVPEILKRLISKYEAPKNEPKVSVEIERTDSELNITIKHEYSSIEEELASTAF